ncbi:MAG: homoserine O-acetyltransferase/O-succinyltransferase family protein [Rhodomicrobium sp.]
MSELPAIEPPLVIAFVNNMPDAALEASETQFRSLAEEAAGHTRIRFSKFYLPGVPRRERGRHYLSQSYSPLSRLIDTPVDGLIVTGAVPSASTFEGEPYWPGFTKLADWAAANGVPAYWSCLAAHAAVKHFDGIERYRMPQKLSGVFECEKAAASPLAAGVPLRWQVPHSRYNDLREADLTAAGYRIVSRLKSGSPDIFVNLKQNLSVFAQGHPEYDEMTLFYEYRRDLGQFLRGQTGVYPRPPEGYFGPGTAESIERLDGMVPPGACAVEHLSIVEELLAKAVIVASWRAVAVRVFANWINLLLEERARRQGANAVGATRAGEVLPGTLERRAG